MKSLTCTQDDREKIEELAKSLFPSASSDEFVRLYGKKVEMKTMNDGGNKTSEYIPLVQFISHLIERIYYPSLDHQPILKRVTREKVTSLLFNFHTVIVGADEKLNISDIIEEIYQVFTKHRGIIMTLVKNRF